MTVTYKRDLEAVDWTEMKTVLASDDFDNGRTPEQLEASFANSFVTCIAYVEGQLVGTARALSDGVCNAYVVDVWTHSALRRQGIGREMLERLLSELPGQHVYLFTDDAVSFYEELGFERQAVGLGRVVGQWLDATSSY